jgi:hypothetical protein
MTPSFNARLGLIRSCVEDLRVNGIDLAGADVCRIEQVVHQHLDYFQLMLGYEPEAPEVVSLIRQEVEPAGAGRRFDIN